MPPTMPTGSSSGHSNRFLIPFVLCVLLLIVVSIFGFMQYGQAQDYKTNVDAKITAASAEVQKTTSSAKDKEFSEKEKSPYKTYVGPSTYGTISFQYPKTWSAYVETTNDSQPLNGYFHPGFVPGTDSGTAFALRVEVINAPYDQELSHLNSNVTSGKIAVAPFRAAKVSSILGTKADGEVNTGQKDSKIYLPLRDKTIEISTESDQFVNDLNTIILPSLTFSP